MEYVFPHRHFLYTHRCRAPSLLSMHDSHTAHSTAPAGTP
jgi:hypothetical protein